MLKYLITIIFWLLLGLRIAYAANGGNTEAGVYVIVGNYAELTTQGKLYTSEENSFYSEENGIIYF